MAECKNLSCENNSNGKCMKQESKEVSGVYKTYDLITEDQWIELIEKQVKRKNEGLKPNKKCMNTECVSNIDGGCYLPTETMLFSVLTDEQWEKVM